MSAVAALLAMLAPSSVRAQRRRRRRCCGGSRSEGRGGPDAGHAADRRLFHTLLANRGQIRRTVKKLPDGVETVTETDNPQLRAVLVRHVKSMYDRLETGRPIHRRDPLFAEIFRNAEKITLKAESTDTGIRVLETSDDPHAVKLIQRHAEVVSLFLKNGHAEVHKNHAVPQ